MRLVNKYIYIYINRYARREARGNSDAACAGKMSYQSAQRVIMMMALRKPEVERTAQAAKIICQAKQLDGNDIRAA